MTDIPDIPPDLEKEAWAEFEKTLDEYIAHYSKEIDRILKAREKQSMPVVSGSEAGRPLGGPEPSDARQGKPDTERD